MPKRVAMITVHECPLASVEGKERGGINVYVYELSKALTNLGWQVDAFTRVQDDVNPRVVVINDNFRVIHIPNGPHTPLGKKDILAALPEFTRHASDFIRSERLSYEVIHSHYYLSGVVANALAAEKQPHVPHVLTFHTLGLMKQLVVRSKDTDDPPERIPIERELVKHADRFITSSETGKEYLAALYDAPEKKIITIPPGVDTHLFRNIPKAEAKRVIGADPNHRIILSVGRIDPVKGFDVLLYALKLLVRRHPDIGKSACIWIVGGDVEEKRRAWNSEQTNLEALRETLGLTTTVKFIPAQSQTNLPSYYNAAEVLVMPSHYESFGMVALEALACGTPVIATDVAGISPILKEFPKGHVISANNPILLARELAHILSHPPPVTPDTQKIIEGLDWHETAKRVAGVYETL